MQPAAREGPCKPVRQGRGPGLDLVAVQQDVGVLGHQFLQDRLIHPGMGQDQGEGVMQGLAQDVQIGVAGQGDPAAKVMHHLAPGRRHRVGGMGGS